MQWRDITIDKASLADHGLPFSDAMARLHVLDSEGVWQTGAHAFAALDGRYEPLATWRRTGDGLVGHIEMPLAVGTVGGATQVHPGVRAAFELIQVGDACELAVVMAAAGLASNLAALKALAGEGIQRGHMKLHNRRLQYDKDQRRSS